jgi:hypothetical protein
MERDEAITLLKRGSDSLRSCGVRSLAIFGSTARNEARSDSDVDILIELTEDRRYSLIDLSNIKFLLNDLVGQPVDLALRSGLRPSYRARIEKDAVPVL